MFLCLLRIIFKISKSFSRDFEIIFCLCQGSLLPAQSPGFQSAADLGSSSSSSGSEDTDDAPLSSLIHKEQNEGLGSSSCVLTKDDLVDGLRVLYLKDGLFMEGVVQEISPPDV